MIQSCVSSTVFMGQGEQEAVSLVGGMAWHMYVDGYSSLICDLFCLL